MTMDCSELIEQLKNIRFLTADNGLKVEAICKAAAAEMERAIQALRAQQTPLDRSRWEGCNYCNEYGVVLAAFDGWSYCNCCGRPLTKEAWAELERRINGGTADV